MIIFTVLWGMVELQTYCLSSLGNHVVDIVHLGTNKQAVWFYAKLNIALMQCLESFRYSYTG